MVLKNFIKQNNIKKNWVPNSKPDIYYKIKINNFVQNDHIVRQMDKTSLFWTGEEVSSQAPEFVRTQFKLEITISTLKRYLHTSLDLFLNVPPLSHLLLPRVPFSSATLPFYTIIPFSIFPITLILPDWSGNTGTSTYWYKLRREEIKTRVIYRVIIYSYFVSEFYQNFETCRVDSPSAVPRICTILTPCDQLWPSSSLLPFSCLLLKDLYFHSVRG